MEVVLEQLRQRDIRETEVFEQLFLDYAEALAETQRQRSYSLQMRQDLTALRQIPSLSSDVPMQASRGGGGAEPAQQHDARLKVLEEKLLHVQEELTHSYRLNAENSRAMLILKEQAQTDEKACVQSEQRVAEMKADAEVLVEKLLAETDRATTLERSLLTMQQEIVSLREQQRSDQLSITALQRENNLLLDKIKRLVNSQAETMNEMNAISRLQNSSPRSDSDAALPAGSSHRTSDVNERELSGTRVLDQSSWNRMFSSSVPEGPASVSIQAHANTATCIAFAASGSFLATGGADKLVKLWNSKDGTSRGSLSGCSKLVMDVDISIDDSLVLGCGYDRSVRIWSASSQKHLKTFNGHTNKVCSARFFQHSKQVVSAGHDRSIRVWDVGSGELLRSLACESRCHSLAVSSDNDTVASAHMDGHVRLSSLRGGGVRQVLFEAGRKPVTCVAFSRTADLLATCARDSCVNLVDIRSQRVLLTLQDSEFRCSGRGSWGRLCWSPDGHYVAAGSASGAICVWETRFGALHAALRSHQQPSPITSVVWAPNGLSIASANESGLLSLWNS